MLRLEDLDPERCRPAWADGMREALAWLGLDWDHCELQSERAAEHAAALDRLADEGRLYPCRCSRQDLRRRVRPDPDGAVAYPGTCRERALPRGGWRASREAIRVRLPAGRVELRDESGLALAGDPAREPGDPVVRRRDGATAYQLAGVVDDARSGVTRVVRGRDLAASTPTQVALQRLLALPTPAYRHHLLLLEEQGGKLAKLHGAVAIDALRAAYDAPALCGRLAWAAGLAPEDASATPRELLACFAWSRVRAEDRALRWTGRALEAV